MRLFMGKGFKDRRVETARVTHLVTNAEFIAGYAAVPIVWDFPFDDTNYTVSRGGVEDLSGSMSPNYVVGDFHHKTPAGITAIVQISSSMVGQTFIAHAMAVQD